MEKVSKKEDERWFAERAKIRHKCKCGHTVYIPAFIDSVICNWCGKTVYKNEQIEFKKKLEKLLKQN